MSKILQFMSEVREGQADSKRFGVLFILDYDWHQWSITKQKKGSKTCLLQMRRRRRRRTSLRNSHKVSL
jgi:hypothetical protein